MRPLIIPFFIPHAGCPHHCLFCNQHLISGSTQPIPDLRGIQAQISAWLHRSPGRPTEVAFYGGSFTLLDQQLQHALLETVQPFIRQEQVQGIRISTRPDALNCEVLQFLQERHVTTVEIGVQSLDDMVLQRAGRGHTAADSLQSIKRVGAAGFVVGAQLLPGLPGDSFAKALQSMQGVLTAGARFVRIYPAVVLQGTALADTYKAGLYQPAGLAEGVKIAARMLDLANKAGIPVVRIGLQADEGLTDPDSIIAGCWHPALGHLVKARLFYDLVCRLASKTTGIDEALLFCHPRQLSEVVGHGRDNLVRWQQAGTRIRQVMVDRFLDLHQIRLEYLRQNITGSLLTSQIY